MARGWDSKSVESQIESASGGRRKSPQDTRSAEQIERERKRESLQLERTRVTRELDQCRTPRYAEVLRRSLDFLDQELAKL